nr:MAG TPA: Protein of unknown function (DUF4021) [Caudoviricetes sp.]
MTSSFSLPRIYIIMMTSIRMEGLYGMGRK